MKLLIMGGTRFLGRALVEAGLAAGHELTLFNRGQSNPGLFPTVEELHGDRDGGLDVLAGQQWDAVVDTCGYVPRLVRASAEFLQESVGHYIFVSSISVYADFATVGMDESAPIGTIEDETIEEITAESYGPLKALCEQAVDAVMGEDRALHIRAGLIVGPMICRIASPIGPTAWAKAAMYWPLATPRRKCKLWMCATWLSGLFGQRKTA